MSEVRGERNRGRLAVWPALPLALTLALGCAPAASGPPAIKVGSSCAACGMDIQDLRFAAERKAEGKWLVYDSIECLIRDGMAGEMWLPDYHTKSLHPAADVWVVKGNIASPMGGGFASFAARPSADSTAAQTQGRVDRLSAFAGAAAQ